MSLSVSSWGPWLYALSLFVPVLAAFPKLQSPHFFSKFQGLLSTLIANGRDLVALHSSKRSGSLLKPFPALRVSPLSHTGSRASERTPSDSGLDYSPPVTPPLRREVYRRRVLPLARALPHEPQIKCHGVCPDDLDRFDLMQVRTGLLQASNLPPGCRAVITVTDGCVIVAVHGFDLGGMSTCAESSGRDATSSPVLDADRVRALFPTHLHGCISSVQIWNASENDLCVPSFAFVEGESTLALPYDADTDHHVITAYVVGLSKHDKFNFTAPGDWEPCVFVGETDEEVPVKTFRWLPPASDSDLLLPIQVELDRTLLRKALVCMRGVPPAASLRLGLKRKVDAQEHRILTELAAGPFMSAFTYIPMLPQGRVLEDFLALGSYDMAQDLAILLSLRGSLQGVGTDVAETLDAMAMHAHRRKALSLWLESSLAPYLLDATVPDGAGHPTPSSSMTRTRHRNVAAHPFLLRYTDRELETRFLRYYAASHTHEMPYLIFLFTSLWWGLVLNLAVKNNLMLHARGLSAVLSTLFNAGAFLACLAMPPRARIKFHYVIATAVIASSVCLTGNSSTLVFTKLMHKPLAQQVPNITISVAAYLLLINFCVVDFTTLLALLPFCALVHNLHVVLEHGLGPALSAPYVWARVASYLAGLCIMHAREARARNTFLHEVCAAQETVSHVVSPTTSAGAVKKTQ